MLIKKYENSGKIKTKKHGGDHESIQALYSLPQPQAHLQYGGSSAAHSLLMVLGVMSMIMLLLPLLCTDAAAYSYTRFSGPVTGPEHKIYVNHDASKLLHHNDGGGGGRGGSLRLDYVGKPEYEFAYGVEDANAHVLHNRNEIRDGDAVKGVYSLIDPDGALRVVKYTADGINGFQAEVTRNGISSIHDQLQHDYKPQPALEAISYSNNHHNHNNAYRPNHQQQQQQQQPQKHYSHLQTHLKGDINVYHPSSFNTHTNGPNLEKLPEINLKPYKPYNRYATTKQPPIVYHYNKNYDDNDDDDDDDDNDDDDDYGAKVKVNKESYKDYQPQYEVHEKSNEDNDENHHHNDKNDNDHKSNNNRNHHKNKKPHPVEDEDDDDDDYDDDHEDYYDVNESEELEEYDENIHSDKNKDESREYY